MNTTVETAAVAEQSVWDKLAVLPCLSEQPEFAAGRREESELEDDLERLAGYIRIADNDIKTWNLPGNWHMHNPETERKRSEWQATYNAKRTRLGKVRDEIGQHGVHTRKYQIDVQAQFGSELAAIQDRTNNALDAYRESLAEEKKLITMLGNKGYPVFQPSDAPGYRRP